MSLFPKLVTKMIKEIKGDITETDCMIIAQGCNCQGVMGAGVALAIRNKWPKAYYSYLDMFEEFNAGPDGENFLGWTDAIQLEPGGKVICNCFTQQYYGPGDRLYLDYDALNKCLQQLIVIVRYYKQNEIAIPRIGCGLAGGDWNKVRKMIEDIIPEDITVKVYYI